MADLEKSSQGPGGPLVRLRVLDAGTMVAGPFVSSILGDLGADVIKIEHPKLDDPMRHWGPFKEGLGLTWKVTARNKRLITLDLKHPKGQDLLKRLVAEADVLVENFRPGTMERWGLGYDVLSVVNPGLIMVRVSGYGQDGPYATRPGYGTVAEAMTGIPSFTGFPEGPPTLSAFALADTIAGAFGALGALAAIFERSRNERNHGQVVDVSLYESLFRLVESQVIGYDQLGVVKQRRGNRIEEDVPRNAYRTRDDRWIAISASSNQTFRRLMECIARPELADDARFMSNPARVDNADQLDSILQDWFAQLSFEEALRRLEDSDVVAGPVLDIADIFAHPQFQARGDIVQVPDADFGAVKMQGVVPRFGRTPGRVRHVGGRKGEHNDEVYRGQLRLSNEEYDTLQAQGVI